MEIIKCMGCNRRFVSVHDYILYAVSKIKAALGFLLFASVILLAATTFILWIAFRKVMS